MLGVAEGLGDCESSYLCCCSGIGGWATARLRRSLDTRVGVNPKATSCQRLGSPARSGGLPGHFDEKGGSHDSHAKCESWDAPSPHPTITFGFDHVELRVETTPSKLPGGMGVFPSLPEFLDCDNFWVCTILVAKEKLYVPLFQAIHSIGF